MPSIFEPALSALSQADHGWIEPESFQAYLTRHGLPPAKTASKISIQTLGTLDVALLRANVMVFRLGAASDGTTRFALARATRTVSEFFLVDTPIPDDLAPPEIEVFVPDFLTPDLYPFRLLGTLTETGAVNVAIASGLLGHALGCDRPFPRVAPATGSSTYDFDVRPHERLPSALWSHVRGQVEIDAVFFGRREGRRVLFVIEAKHGAPSNLSSLAKTKLAYPCSAIATKGLPSDISIVPVYLRSWTTSAGNRLRFSVKECRPWNQSMDHVSTMEIVSAKLFEMPFE